MIIDYVKHMNYTESIEYKDGILLTKEAKHNFNTAFTCFKFVDGTPFGKRIF